MGQFTFDESAVTIPPTSDVVLQRLPLTGSDKESFILHRTVTYSVAADERNGPFEYTVPPASGDFTTDLASVPQLLTWLVPKSGRHLPAALVHDAMVDDPEIDRFEADRRFRDGMGDLGVGFIRRWIMWTAVSLKTIQKRGTTSLRFAMAATIAVVLVLGVLATVTLVTDKVWVPWMGDRHWGAELVLGLSGAVIIPMFLGILLWRPIRIAGVITGVGLAVLLHAVALTAGVYFGYLLLERLPRRVQQVLGAAIMIGAAAAFVYGCVATVA